MPLLDSHAHWTAAVQQAKTDFLADWTGILDAFPVYPDLDAVLDAFGRVAQGHGNRAQVDAALAAYRGQTSKSMARTAVDKLLRAAYEEFEERFPPPEVPVPQAFSELFTPHHLFVRPQSYACGDCAAYEGELRNPADPSIRNRAWAASNARVVAVSELNNRANQWPYSAQTISEVGTRVLEAKFGVCTSFALAAGKVLLDKDFLADHRLEIVAAAAHCYVVVNRRGDARRPRQAVSLDDAGSWEPGRTFVVDPWLGSLGYECVFESLAAYPQDKRNKFLAQATITYAREKDDVLSYTAAM